MIFLTGPHCAGKTTIAKILTHHNFAHIDLGPTLRRIHREGTNGLSFEEWLSRGETQRGPHFTDNLLVEAINKYIERLLLRATPVQDLIICGSRSLEGINYIVSRVTNLNRRKNVIVWVDAPKHLLWRRFCEKNGPISMTGFEELLEKDRELGLDTIRKQAQYILTNDSLTIEGLVRKVRELFFGTLKYSSEGLLVTIEGEYRIYKEQRI